MRHGHEVFFYPSWWWFLPGWCASTLIRGTRRSLLLGLSLVKKKFEETAVKINFVPEWSVYLIYGGVGFSRKTFTLSAVGVAFRPWWRTNIFNGKFAFLEKNLSSIDIVTWLYYVLFFLKFLKKRERKKERKKERKRKNSQFGTNFLIPISYLQPRTFCKKKGKTKVNESELKTREKRSRFSRQKRVNESSHGVQVFGCLIPPPLPFYPSTPPCLPSSSRTSVTTPSSQPLVLLLLV